MINSLENLRIEGFGNEVLIASIVIIVAFVPILVFLLNSFSRRQNNSIHPSSRDHVNSVRRRLPSSNNLYSNRLNNLNQDEQSNQEGNQNDDNQSANGNHEDSQDDSNTSGEIVQVDHYGMDNQCPVCLNEPNYPIETNCGHLFCAQCIIVYWRHGTWRGAVPCPVCRQTVSVLLACFRNTPRPVGVNSEGDASEVNQILHCINDYNRRFSGGPRPWLDYLWDLPTLLRHLSSEFFTVGGLMYMFRIRIVICFVAAVMYLISPLDMIPEAVFGLFGLLDDMFVVLLLAIYVTIVYRRFLAHRWEEENYT